MLVLQSLFLSTTAFAVDLSLVTEETPFTGVTIAQYRASSPSTDVYVARVDLCADSIHMDATYPPSSYATTGSWAASRGVQVATNGDFYTSGPQVYGDAVGATVHWPADQTGVDKVGEWYHQDHGYLAFLHDEVTFTHSKWVKETHALTTGWAPSTVAPDPPPGTIAMVSGFPQLVIDGSVFTCTSPTASDCFPDRTDMRARHPRTAMGLTEDRSELILAVVDGRTSTNTGMYGAELAEVMGELGAHNAFNIDGGGSSQMWVEGDGYINDYSGNNYYGGARAMANHWGIYAGGSAALRPGHCPTEPACELIPPPGGILDDTSDCFALFGEDAYWRSVDTGYGSHLWWTNAWTNDLPSNQAWWRIEMELAGEYEVEVWIDPTYGVYNAVRYTVMASGAEHEVIIDQSTSDGWTSLGTFSFAAGGQQWVKVSDNYAASVGSSQHISVDALQLSRIGGWCGDGECADEEGCDCPEDCALEEEIPDNDVDDDCDGEVDETTEDTGSSDTATEEPPADDPPADDGTPSDTDADTASPDSSTDFEADPEERGPTDDTEAGPADDASGGDKGCGCAHAAVNSLPSVVVVFLGAAAWGRRRRTLRRVTTASTPG
jgi:hypothetical protein